MLARARMCAQVVSTSDHSAYYLEPFHRTHIYKHDLMCTSVGIIVFVSTYDSTYVLQQIGGFVPVYTPRQAPHDSQPVDFGPTRSHLQPSPPMGVHTRVCA